MREEGERKREEDKERRGDLGVDGGATHDGVEILRFDLDHLGKIF